MAIKRKLPLRVALRQNTNVKSAGYNKFYAEVVLRQGLTQDGLIDHITAHIPGVTRSMTTAVIETLATCIPELISQGNSVKLDGIGTFSPTIESSQGLTVNQMKKQIPSSVTVVHGVHIRFRPDGTKLCNITSKQLRKKTAIELMGFVGSQGSIIPFAKV